VRRFLELHSLWLFSMPAALAGGEVWSYDVKNRSPGTENSPVSHHGFAATAQSRAPEFGEVERAESQSAP
jgi:hypothetical protein